MTLEINVIKIDYKRTIERLLSASSIASIRPIGLVFLKNCINVIRKRSNILLMFIISKRGDTKGS